MGIGPQDVALAIIGAVFKNGFVKNKVLEFVGPGITNLSVDFRNGIDVMTTETTCLSSIWCTDDKIKKYYEIHGRSQNYKKLEPGKIAYYAGLIKVDLTKVVPMIALPFHPSNVFSISELNENAADILRSIEVEGQKQIDNQSLDFRLTNKIVNGKIKVDQGIVAGCAGGIFENIHQMAMMLQEKSIGSDYFSLSVYPASQPIYLELVKSGAMVKLMEAGVVVKTAFCGPCFGAGDVPANNGLSIRHTTRNFPYREGSKPGAGQIATVALMDARSIAATAINGGSLTPGTDIEFPDLDITYSYNSDIYKNRVYNGYAKPDQDACLKYGPNIADWPKLSSLTDNIILQVAAVLKDPVTTTDELIPSGETSSYRSNPLKLAEFTLSRKDPGYVDRVKLVQLLEKERKALVKGDITECSSGLKEVLRKVFGNKAISAARFAEILESTSFGSIIVALKPGDGSAREQAASCQRVLGGIGNIAVEYATKRYRSNLVNWGMLPFTISPAEINDFEVGEYIFIPGIRKALREEKEEIKAEVIGLREKREITLQLRNLTKNEREVVLAGGLVNYYAAGERN